MLFAKKTVGLAIRRILVRYSWKSQEASLLESPVLAKQAGAQAAFAWLAAEAAAERFSLKEVLVYADKSSNLEQGQNDETVRREVLNGRRDYRAAIKRAKEDALLAQWS